MLLSRQYVYSCREGEGWSCSDKELHRNPTVLQSSYLHSVTAVCLQWSVHIKGKSCRLVRPAGCNYTTSLQQTLIVQAVAEEQGRTKPEGVSPTVYFCCNGFMRCSCHAHNPVTPEPRNEKKCCIMSSLYLCFFSCSDLLILLVR